RLKALRGKPKAKHIKSELLSAVVRTAPPAGCRSPVGERGRNTDFTGWPSTEGQTGSQHALEGKTMNTQAQAFHLMIEVKYGDSPSYWHPAFEAETQEEANDLIQHFPQAYGEISRRIVVGAPSMDCTELRPC
ncbi:hypothetical protein AAIH16_35790, partial [Pseudomonas aeruginosa]